MTTANAVELVRLQFPDAREQEIVTLLSLAQQEFCQDTGIIRKWVDVTLTTTLAYSLPADFDRLLSVSSVEVGDTLSTSRLNYEVRDGVIYFTDNDDELATTMPAEVQSIRIEYIARPTALTTISSTLTVSSEHHGGLVARVLQRLCEKAGNYQGAEFHLISYKAAVRSAKISASLR